MIWLGVCFGTKGISIYNAHVVFKANIIQGVLLLNVDPFSF